METTHGIDYLIDHYALLGVKRGADEAEIKKAYHAKQRLYHPDRYEGLAEELKRCAAEKSRLLVEAYATLADREKRAEYDRRLAGWTGPISRDGTPIVDLSRPHFRPQALLNGFSSADRDELKKMALQMSGHEPNTLALLERLHAAAESPAADVAEAYQDALLRRGTYLAVLELLAWELAGFGNQPIDNRIGPGHADAIDARIAQARARAMSGIDEMLMLAAAGEIKLLGSTGEFDPEAPDAAAALTRHREDAAARFDAAAERIRQAVTERAANAAKALALVMGAYDPPGQALQPKLLVVLKAGEAEWSMSWRIEGTTVSSGIERPSPSEALAAGYSVIRFEVRDGLDIRDQLMKVVLDHFERWADQTHET